MPGALVEGSPIRIRKARNGPEPAGPYSQAVLANGFVFTSGQIPAVTGSTEPAVSFGDQVRQTFRNLADLLDAAGSGLDSVVKVNAYLTHEEHLDEYNEIYAETFTREQPARTTVGVRLWGVLLEVDCIAVCPRRSRT